MGDDAHISVLEREVCEALAPVLLEGGAFVDATCGLAGHTSAILRASHPAHAILFDRDTVAMQRATQRLGQVSCTVHWVEAPFSALGATLDALGFPTVSAILADLGVSSLQLDTPERGFSWRADGPLDMRMDPTSGESAADLIARIDASELTRLLRSYGEEPDAPRIAAAIVAARPRRTLELARVVAEAMSAPQRRKLGRRIHPATRTFQALRIAVNGELDELDRLLAEAPERLAPGGRLAMISFHSLEDRRIKQAFRRLSQAPAPPAGVPIRADELPPAKFGIPAAYARGVVAGPAETESNPRARSARLRVLERTNAA